MRLIDYSQSHTLPYSIYYAFQIIRERVSTATLLLIAKSARSLSTFHVRRNAVVQRCDWPRQPDWSTEYWRWLQHTSKSYERTEEAIAQLLGGSGSSGWHMLADRDFRRVIVRVRD